ncbi:MAG: hypothetical protein HWD58_07435 [Bacteroidota bacterium]|nr:MAG: hypothetical protein HWD58_07435 [Bacteroidota bacterium]
MWIGGWICFSKYARGVPPFSYSWSGPSGYTASIASISNLVAGSYSITVVDGNNCTGSSVVDVQGSQLQ